MVVTYWGGERKDFYGELHARFNTVLFLNLGSRYIGDYYSFFDIL